MAVSLSLLSAGPHIRKERGRLVATTSWLVRVVTLGLALREVIVDPKRQVLVLRDRRAWFFRRTRKLPFRFIEAVTYGYTDVNPEEWWSWTHDSAEVFS